jgi:hypothetical protein
MRQHDDAAATSSAGAAIPALDLVCLASGELASSPRDSRLRLVREGKTSGGSRVDHAYARAAHPVLVKHNRWNT